MRYTVRPLSDRTWLSATDRQATRFKAKWGATLELLDQEVGALDGRDVVIETDITEADLKLNGELRANARPSSDAVVLAFESKHGPLVYRCDRFYTDWGWQGPAWQHNLRAIALTLGALRAVDRYGATETGQQYAGFKQLGAGTAMGPSHWTQEQAYDLLAELLDLADIANLDVEDAVLVRRARAVAHPDRNAGDRARWDQVEQAARALGIQ